MSIFVAQPLKLSVAPNYSLEIDTNHTEIGSSVDEVSGAGAKYSFFNLLVLHSFVEKDLLFLCSTKRNFEALHTNVFSI